MKDETIEQITIYFNDKSVQVYENVVDTELLENCIQISYQYGADIADTVPLSSIKYIRTYMKGE